MNKAGPIVIIDDDIDDQNLMKELLTQLAGLHDIEVFSDGAIALEFLRKPGIQPFLILSDINMPKLNGFQFRQIIFDDPVLRGKCFPYIFITSNVSPEGVKKAYGLSTQGIFQKSSTLQGWRAQLELIVTYWSQNKSPSQY